MVDLKVFFDESNHGRKNEVVVALFSYLNADSSLEILTKRKERIKLFEKYKEILISPGRDIRFLMLNQEDLLEGENQLIASAPALIKDYLNTNYSEIRRAEECALELFLDGENVRSYDINELARKVKRNSPIVRAISIHFYPKLNGRDYKYVPGLEYADNGAHILFRNKEARNWLEAEGKRVNFCRAA